MRIQHVKVNISKGKVKQKKYKLAGIMHSTNHTLEQVSRKSVCLSTTGRSLMQENPLE